MWDRFARCFLAFGLLAIAACSAEQAGGLCTPGETQYCTCVIDEGPVLGEETCAPDGESWVDCTCGDAPRDGGTRLMPRDSGVIRDGGPRDGGLPLQCSPIQTRRDAECVPVAVSAGGAHTCVIRASGEASCFGDDTFGQLGRSEVLAPDPMSAWRFEDLVVTTTIAAAIEAGVDYTCYLDLNGRVWCFGSNAEGKLGSGLSPETLTSTGTPIAVLGVEGIVGITVGRTHACAVEPTSSVLLCWGSNAKQQLGRGEPASTLPYAPEAKKVDMLMDVVEAAAGDGFSCARDGSGRVFCLGKNTHGENGDGSARPEIGRPVRTGIPAAKLATSIVAGDDHACALLDDTTVMCWGSNVQGQVGLDFSMMMSSTPTVVNMFATGAPLDQVIELSAGARHTCARRMDRSVVCWGDQVALCDPEGTNKPVQPRSFYWYGTIARGLAAGGAHSCAIRGDYDVHCYGDNTLGQSMPTEPSSACEHDEPVGILKP